MTLKNQRFSKVEAIAEMTQIALPPVTNRLREIILNC